jgi:hypothetical protein
MRLGLQVFRSSSLAILVGVVCVSILACEAGPLAWASTPMVQPPPMKLSTLLEALRKGNSTDPPAELIGRIERFGVNFEVTEDVEWQLLQAGATQEIVEAVRASHRGDRALAAQSPRIWVDRATGLKWINLDQFNSYQGASSHCRYLQISGYSGWRLPTIDELMGIFADSESTRMTRKMRRVWSSSVVAHSSDEWTFDFTAGLAEPAPLGRGGMPSASLYFCVRSYREASSIAPKAVPQTFHAERDETTKTTWTDPSTGLMWVGKSSGSKMDWRAANEYCGNLRLGGFYDWSLPSVPELMSIYDKSTESKWGGDAWHVKGNIQGSDWVWSSSQGAPTGEAWAFSFGDGEWFERVVESSDMTDALCARHSGLEGKDKAAIVALNEAAWERTASAKLQAGQASGARWGKPQTPPRPKPQPRPCCATVP